MTQTLTTERMAEIAKLAIRLQHISSCAAVTSSGETIMHHTHVDEILSALHDVTSELLANREALPVVVTDEMALAFHRALNDGGIGESDLEEIKVGLRGALCNITAPPAPAPAVPQDYFGALVEKARVSADKAMQKYPQPNYVLNKVAEESGEVIKAVIHYTEGREEWANVEGEIIDNLAMLIRLVIEGDQVIGFTPPDACRAAMLAQPVSQGYKLPDGFKLMPIEMTDEIGEAIALEARCCGGIALCIYEAALAAAPEGRNEK